MQTYVDIYHFTDPVFPGALRVFGFVRLQSLQKRLTCILYDIIP